MALRSKSFRGNQKLEACSTQNAAHILLGATGEHVAKIQFALFQVDGQKIERSELIQQRYGPSTAAAVLAYKKKRAIINRTYQSSEDNIVGIMTIASLDREMAAQELLPKPPGDCDRSGTAQPDLTFLAPSSNSALVGRGVVGAPKKSTAPRQLGGVCRIYIAMTSNAMTDGYPLSATLERAKDCLFEHGMALNVEFSRGVADIIKFESRVKNLAGEAGSVVEEVRKASEDVRPGIPKILRVIICRMGTDVFGETFRGRRLGTTIVPPYVCLNSETIEKSNATLIHEMIHASKTDEEAARVDHDSEPFSVFFAPDKKEILKGEPGRPERTFLKPEHALTLSTCFFHV